MPVSTALYLQLMYASQALICCYGGFQSVNAVTNLQTYEKTSEKLAEWSQTAKDHLTKTRTTQTTGAVAVLLSLTTSLTLAAAPQYLPHWLRMTLSPLLLVTVLGARGYIKNYWNPSDKKDGATKVPPLPNLEQYNEAQKWTDDLLQTLEYMEYGWVATSFVAGMVGSR
ncbi:hypothetical protein LTR53_003358 [Teratosphaeriaceae sp. CCFEE 6253]|nr:hypothetical protein LTR53_003358 [Teratosphaeriaceae sp. CCFEE 6253]